MPTCRVCRYRFEGTRCPICGHRPPPLRPARARATPARARRAVVRAPARPPRQIRGGPTIEGIVHQTAGPHQEPAPLSFWKFASGLLGIMVFAPLLIMLWMFKVAFRIAFGILGFGFRGGGEGVLGTMRYLYLTSFRGCSIAMNQCMFITTSSKPLTTS